MKFEINHLDNNQKGLIWSSLAMNAVKTVLEHTEYQALISKIRHIKVGVGRIEIVTKNALVNHELSLLHDTLVGALTHALEPAGYKEEVSLFFV